MKEQLDRIEEKLDDLIDANASNRVKISWHEKALGGLLSMILFIYAKTFLNQ
jgi:hypothetical protein